MVSPDLLILPPEDGDTHSDDEFERLIVEGVLARAQVDYLRQPRPTNTTEEPAPTKPLPEAPAPSRPSRSEITRSSSEPRFSRRPKAKNWRDRMAADQPPPHIRKPQLGE